MNIKVLQLINYHSQNFTTFSSEILNKYKAIKICKNINSL